jgi:hypothetical protein
VNAESTKAMEEALQAAVKRMNAQNGHSGNGGNGSNGVNAPEATGMMNGAVEPMGMLMSFLPKLLQNNDGRDEVLEKLEGLQKEEMAPMREQVLLLRKQLHRVLKTQELMLVEFRELRKQQTAVSHAVLDLAAQMARVEIVNELPEEDEEIYERGTSAAPGGQVRTRTQNEHGRAEPKPSKK